MQIPSNMLITRIQPGLYMSSWMVVWAAVSAATAAVHNFGGRWCFSGWLPTAGLWWALGFNLGDGLRIA